jgi:hypothetical protein
MMFFGNKAIDFKRDMLPANSEYSFILNMAAARSSECRYISTTIHGNIAQKPITMYFATPIAVPQMEINQATGLVKVMILLHVGKRGSKIEVSINVQEY